jgi:hypothetical protein
MGREGLAGGASKTVKRLEGGSERCTRALEAEPGRRMPV